MVLRALIKLQRPKPQGRRWNQNEQAKFDLVRTAQSEQTETNSSAVADGAVVRSRGRGARSFEQFRNNVA